MTSTAKIKANEWQTRRPRPWLAGGTSFRGIEMSEAEVVFRQGDFVSGKKDNWALTLKLFYKV
jgi:hypothetical protein